MLRGWGKGGGVLGGVSQVNAALSTIWRYRGAAILSQIAVEWVTKLPDSTGPSRRETAPFLSPHNVEAQSQDFPEELQGSSGRTYDSSIFQPGPPPNRSWLGPDFDPISIWQGGFRVRIGFESGQDDRVQIRSGGRGQRGSKPEG